MVAATPVSTRLIVTVLFVTAVAISPAVPEIVNVSTPRVTVSGVPASASMFNVVTTAETTLST